MTDIEELIDELFELRNEFGDAIDDDYRQSRIDVAIEQLEECRAVKKDYQEAGLWNANEENEDE